MILDPHWLITIVTVIVEITPTKSNDGIASEHIRSLQKGVASKTLFEHFFKDFLVRSSCIALKHLLLILRSYCLIFPLQPEPKALSFPEGADGAKGGASYTKYIIPCILRDDLNDKKVDIPEGKYCVFYFDFCGFLPDEIYHRLMCLASAASKPGMKERNEFSKQRCVFYKLHGTNWIIKLERDKHRMKFAFR